jgi:molybdate transport system substrate-binding protein
MTRRALLVLVLLLGPFVAGPVLAQGGRRPLQVAAAANLKTAAEELKKAFEARHPEAEVVITFGASGTFFAQLQSGAPFDVFLSADRDYPAKVIEAGLAAAADERVYAFGKLVAWRPAGSTLDLEGRGLAALRDPRVKRIAMANPAVAPFGRATEAALRAAGVRDAVKDKVVLGTSVAQAAQFATTGAADVVFLPWSLTIGTELGAGRIWPVPETLYPRIAQSGVVLASAKEPALARAFLAFLATEPARVILARYGYGLP